MPPSEPTNCDTRIQIESTTTPSTTTTTNHSRIISTPSTSLLAPSSLHPPHPSSSSSPRPRRSRSADSNAQRGGITLESIQQQQQQQQVKRRQQHNNQNNTKQHISNEGIDDTTMPLMNRSVLPHSSSSTITSSSSSSSPSRVVTSRRMDHLKLIGLIGMVAIVSLWIGFRWRDVSSDLIITPPHTSSACITTATTVTNTVPHGGPGSGTEDIPDVPIADGLTMTRAVLSDSIIDITSPSFLLTPSPPPNRSKLNVCPRLSTHLHTESTLWITSPKTVSPEFLRARRGRVDSETKWISLCRSDEDGAEGFSDHLPTCCGILSVQHESCAIRSHLDGYGSLNPSVSDHRLRRVDHSWGGLMSRLHIEEAGPSWPSYDDMREADGMTPTQAASTPANTKTKGSTKSNKPKPTRVLIVCDELSDTGLPSSVSPYGGAGTASFLLARTLASSTLSDGSPEFEVHILHMRFHWLTPEQRKVASTKLGRLKIQIYPLPSHIHTIRQENTFVARLSYMLFLYLSQVDAHESTRFQIVHLPDYLGYGYVSQNAQKQGLILRETILIVTCHGTSSWANEGNRILPPNVEEVEKGFYERRSIELAQVLISPSYYMLSWMEARSWSLPTNRSIVIGNVLPHKEELNLIDPNKSEKSSEFTNRCELIFFGRLEQRKGVVIFLESLDLLFSSPSKPTMFLRQCDITFLGRTFAGPGSVQPSEIQARAFRNNWPKSVKLTFLNAMGRKDALRYLSKPNSGRLAIIASPMDNSPYVVAECLVYNVPFLASNTGGIPELIRPEDRQTILFRSNDRYDLLKVLTNLLSVPFAGDLATPFLPPIARPSRTIEEVTMAHLTLHRDIVTALQGRTTETLKVWNQIVQEAKIKTSLMLNGAHRTPEPLPPDAAAAAAAASSSSSELDAYPLVSVCVTHFHRPDLVMHTLRAIESQTYPASSIQVIVLDDGSWDPAVRKELDATVKPFISSHGPLWSFRSIPNSYLGSARNQCRTWMRGTWLLFLDDDDMPRSHMIQRLIEVARTSEAQVISSMFQLFWGKTDPSEIFELSLQEKVSSPPPSQQELEIGRYLSTGPLAPKKLSIKPEGLSDEEFDLNLQPPALFAFSGGSLTLAFFLNVLGGANLFVRTCVYDVLGGFSEFRETGFEDYEFLLNIVLHQVRHEVIPEPLLLVRRQIARTSMQSQTEMWKNRQRILMKYFDAFSHSNSALDLSGLLAFSWKLYTEGGEPPLTLTSFSTTSHDHHDLGLSERHFSSIQGQYGWSYYFLMLASDPTADKIDTAWLDALPKTQGKTHKAIPAQYDQKPYPRWTLGPTAPPRYHQNTWPHHTAIACHPAVIQGTGTIHAIRRWVSQWQGPARIELQLNLAHRRECGDGVTYHLYHDRDRIWRYTETNINPTFQPHVTSEMLQTLQSLSHGGIFPCALEGDTVMCEIELKVGSRIDIIVSPGPDETCDSTEMTLHIMKIERD